jgi:hypothetical protein
MSNGDDCPDVLTSDLESRIAREYSELCSDWRHRDGMLWQSLAASLAATGLVLGSTVTSSGGQWSVKAALFVLAFLMNVIVLLKIVKDNIYQHGTSELLQRMQAGVGAALEAPDDRNLRIRRPSDRYGDARIQGIHPRWLYDWLARRSTFQWFYAVQLFLVLLTVLGITVCTILAANR